MIRFLKSITEEFETFILNEDWIRKIRTSFNKDLWCVVNENNDGKVNECILFSFMYSTWTQGD